MYHETSLVNSSSESSDIKEQVTQAIRMLEPRFHKHTGKLGRYDDSVVLYRLFAFLERERQRARVKHGHPEELSLNDHLSGLCAMALEDIDDRSDA